MKALKCKAPIESDFVPNLPSMRLIKGFSLSKEEAYTTVLLIGIRKEARSQVLHLSRNKRYTLTPEQLKWDKFKLTYKYSFAIPPPSNAAAQYSCRKWEKGERHPRRKLQRVRLMLVLAEKHKDRYFSVEAGQVKVPEIRLLSVRVSCTLVESFNSSWRVFSSRVSQDVHFGPTRIICQRSPRRTLRLHQ